MDSLEIKIQTFLNVKEKVNNMEQILMECWDIGKVNELSFLN